MKLRIIILCALLGFSVVGQNNRSVSHCRGNLIPVYDYPLLGRTLSAQLIPAVIEEVRSVLVDFGDEIATLPRKNLTSDHWVQLEEIVRSLDIMDERVSMIVSYLEHPRRRRLVFDEVNCFQLFSRPSDFPNASSSVGNWAEARRRVDAELSKLRRSLIKSKKALPAALRLRAAFAGDDYEGLGLVDWLLTNFSELRSAEPLQNRNRRIIQDRQIGFGPSVSRSTVALADYLKLNHRDVVLDVGSGFGRFALLFATQSPARVVGVELGLTRVAAAIKSARELDLKNVEFLAADIFSAEAEAILESATVIYLFDPLSRSDLRRFMPILRRLVEGTDKRIVIHGQTLDFKNERWLNQLHYDRANELRVFGSK